MKYDWLLQAVLFPKSQTKKKTKMNLEHRTQSKWKAKILKELRMECGFQNLSSVSSRHSKKIWIFQWRERNVASERNLQVNIHRKQKKKTEVRPNSRKWVIISPWLIFLQNVMQLEWRHYFLFCTKFLNIYQDLYQPNRFFSAYFWMHDYQKKPTHWNLFKSDDNERDEINCAFTKSCQK